MIRIRNRCRTEEPIESPYRNRLDSPPRSNDLISFLHFAFGGDLGGDRLRDRRSRNFLSIFSLF